MRTHPAHPPGYGPAIPISAVTWLDMWFLDHTCHKPCDLPVLPKYFPMASDNWICYTELALIELLPKLHV